MKGLKYKPVFSHHMLLSAKYRVLLKERSCKFWVSIFLLWNLVPCPCIFLQKPFARNVTLLLEETKKWFLLLLAIKHLIKIRICAKFHFQMASSFWVKLKSWWCLFTTCCRKGINFYGNIMTHNRHLNKVNV